MTPPESTVTKLVKKRNESIQVLQSPAPLLHKLGAVFHLASKEARINDHGFLQHLFNSKGHSPSRLAKRLIMRAKARSGYPATWRLTNVALSLPAWHKARKTNDFSIFAKRFKHTIARVRAVSTFMMGRFQTDSPYEARLDRLTPGLRLDDIERYKAQILPHRHRIVENELERMDAMPEDGVLSCPKDVQKRIIERIIAGFGLSDKHHIQIKETGLVPLCFHNNDTITLLVKYHEDDVAQTVLDAIHEFGHGLYRALIPDKNRNGFMALIDSHYNGPDEAVALLMEHFLMRSDSAASFLHDVIAEEMGADMHPDLTQDALKARLKSSKSFTGAVASPSLYPLLLLQHYEVEKALINDRASVDDVPQLWEEACAQYTGMPFSDDHTQNALQSPIWAAGEIGRFPAGYFVGTLMAAQMHETMMDEHPDIADRVADGDFSGITEWCQTHIFNQPRRADFNNFMIEATGKPLDAQAYIDHTFEASLAPTQPHATQKLPIQAPQAG